MRIGKVYFVEAPGRIKIGYTVNPDDRLAKLRQVDMETLSVIAVIDATRRLERHLHDKLAPFRLKGEWYLDCAVVRAAIDDCLSSKETHKEEKTFPAPVCVLDEMRFVTEAAAICAELIIYEKRNGATSNEALSLVAIKTGLSHGRVWTLHYRTPKSISAAEFHALISVAGPDSAAVRAAKALVEQAARDGSVTHTHDADPPGNV